MRTRLHTKLLYIMKTPLLLLLLLWLGISANAFAQESHLINPGTFLQHSASPKVIEDRIVDAAIRYQSYSPVPRIALFDIAFPADAEEYRSLDGYGVVVLSVISQSADELPPSRVYVRVGEKNIELRLFSSAQSKVEKSNIASNVFGPYRWDGLYLFPVYLRMQGQALVMDFAKNRSDFVLGKFDTPVTETLAKFPVEKPLRDRPPESALIGLISREYPGFLTNQ